MSEVTTLYTVAENAKNLKRMEAEAISKIEPYADRVLTVTLNTGPVVVARYTGRVKTDGTQPTKRLVFDNVESAEGLSGVRPGGRHGSRTWEPCVHAIKSFVVEITTTKTVEF